MRTTTLALPLLAFAALGLLVAPAVMAGGEAGQAKSAEARANAEALRANHTHGNDTDENETDGGNRTPKNHTRPETPTRGPHNAHVPAHVTAFWTRMADLRAAWHENLTQVREDCRAASVPDNATGEERSAHAQCIREGVSDLRAWLRAELQDAREDFRAGHGAWKAARRA